MQILFTACIVWTGLRTTHPSLSLVKDGCGREGMGQCGGRGPLIGRAGDALGGQQKTIHGRSGGRRGCLWKIIWQGERTETLRGWSGDGDGTDHRSHRLAPAQHDVGVLGECRSSPNLVPGLSCIAPHRLCCVCVLLAVVCLVMQGLVGTSSLWRGMKRSFMAQALILFFTIIDSSSSHFSFCPRMPSPSRLLRSLSFFV